MYRGHITATGGFLPAAAHQVPFVPPPSPGRSSDPSNEQTFAGVGVPCRWGTPCGMLLTDVSHAGVQKHLSSNHVLPLCNPGEHRPRGTCEWYPERGVKCGREMYQNQYGRHVATVHLECNRCKCERCGAKFTRIDGLARHSKTCRPS
ncbi:uncharacterized protein LAESUDRAFT_546708 [Laetiporus sulphureus 93-53]|uniref:C2H2-type domain-containing protein n=1 Tax=Laetiporus sulphureus 93-53 TaxID=1314785 RepID=A0A165FPL2_9APHY|nr:uncharacterized protein LAESUDRAFT_546708 [Laetiporus sulphureus 93-53]KZT09284.1 hypothetical protein LAESUDRAFT_546708 [Laetiporus sulphureus 93-53]